MNRPLKNKTRGKQKGALPAKSSPAPALNVQNFDGRANLAAGNFEQQLYSQDIVGDGQTVGWKKAVTGR